MQSLIGLLSQYSFTQSLNGTINHWLSTRDAFAPHGTFAYVWRLTGFTRWGCATDILKCTEQPPLQQKVIQLKMSIVMKLKKSINHLSSWLFRSPLFQSPEYHRILKRLSEMGKKEKGRIWIRKFSYAGENHLFSLVLSLIQSLQFTDKSLHFFFID